MEQILSERLFHVSVTVSSKILVDSKDIRSMFKLLFTQLCIGIIALVLNKIITITSFKTVIFTACPNSSTIGLIRHFLRDDFRIVASRLLYIVVCEVNVRGQSWIVLIEPIPTIVLYIRRWNNRYFLDFLNT